MKRTYSETLDFLYAQLPMYQKQGEFTKKIDLSTTTNLLSLIGDPHLNLKVIHVAGTNGKGSVSHAIASMLSKNGLRIGLYTSPHYVDFRERIRIGFEMIPPDFVVDFVATHENKFTALKASFFEFTVVMAFSYFASQKVDFAVIEVGLGGRLDSTNVVEPILSIITNIGFDHMDVLGHTLPEIASEKAGIIKAEVPVVVGEYQVDTWPVFVAKAKQEKSPINLSADLVELADSPDFITLYADKLIQLDKARLQFKGPFAKRNLQTATAAYTYLQKIHHHLKSLGTVVDALNTLDLLSGYRGRYFVIQQEPKIILDAGHNIAAWQELASSVQHDSAGQLHVVCGFVKGKSPKAFFESFDRETQFYLGNIDIFRNSPVADTLAQISNESYQISPCETIRDCYDLALNVAEPSDTILVAGSTFVVGEILKSIQKTNSY